MLETLSVTVAQHRARPVAQPPTVLAIAVAAFTVASMVACSSSSSVANDGGSDGSGGVRNCTSATVCDGTLVRACSNGRPAETLEDCAEGGGTGAPGACSLGRCTSPACAAAEATLDSFVGCLFYTLVVENVDSEAGSATSVLLTNPAQSSAIVTLERRDTADRLWHPAQVAVVPPAQAQRLSFNDPRFAGNGFFAAQALRLVSDTPVTAAHVQSDDAQEGARSTGGTLLLPAHVLGSQYMVMTYPQNATADVSAVAGSRGGAGQIIVVGTQDGTSASVQVSPHASVSGAAGTQDGGGGVVAMLLDEGDVYQLYSLNEGDDLSGSTVVASKPVVVFSGNISTSYGRSAPGVNSPDMAHEQMLPISNWGTKYVAAALPPQAATCDSILGGPGRSLWRVLAQQDGTLVTFGLGSGVALSPHNNGPMKAGEVLEVVATGGSFYVSANNPVLVTQGMDCEPTLSTAVPVEQLLTDLSFAVLPYFDQMVAVVRRQGGIVSLDNVAITDDMFQPAGGNFEVAQVPLTPPCPAGAGACVHHLQGEFGMTLRGMDVVCSYAMTAPTWSLQCIEPSSPSCVP
jgi:hypothetical protein